MEKISSTSNAKIKYVEKLKDKAKFRNEENCFVVEGMKMLSEADSSLIRNIYVSESFKDAKEVPELFKGCNVTLVTEQVFKSMSDTKTPQGILGVIEKKCYELNDMLKGDDTLLLILEDIQDPGNLGTMIRTAEGAGATGVIATKGTVDLYSPKTVRSTMGSLFRVPVMYVEDISATIKDLQKAGVSLFAAHLKGKESYTNVSYKGAAGFLIGNEGNGLKEETADLADTYIRIPMEGQVESLNAAIAATLLMYEAHRQRAL